MPLDMPAPGSPADWLRHARSDLATARVSDAEEILLETRCFHAQQAAEKSIKAVLVHEGLPVPKTHNLRVLLELLPSSISIPTDVALSVRLTPYAVSARYPGIPEPIEEEEYREAVRLAELTLRWAEEKI